MKLVFGHVFILSERNWTILALRWAAFFFVMAFAAEYIRRTMSTEDLGELALPRALCADAAFCTGERTLHHEAQHRNAGRAQRAAPA